MRTVVYIVDELNTGYLSLIGEHKEDEVLGEIVKRHEEVSADDGFFEEFKHKVFFLDLAVFPRNIFDDIGYHSIIIASISILNHYQSNISLIILLSSSSWAPNPTFSPL